MARGRDCIICGVRIDRKSPIKASLIFYLYVWFARRIQRRRHHWFGWTDLRLDEHAQMAFIKEWKKKSKRREKKGKKVEIRIVFFVCFVCWNYFWFAGVRRVCYARIPPLSLRFDTTLMDKHDGQTFMIWHMHIYHLAQPHLSSDTFMEFAYKYLRR